MNLRGGGCGSSNVVTPYPIKTQTTKVAPGLTT